MSGFRWLAQQDPGLARAGRGVGIVSMSARSGAGPVYPWDRDDMAQSNAGHGASHVLFEPVSPGYSDTEADIPAARIGLLRRMMFSGFCQVIAR